MPDSTLRKSVYEIITDRILTLLDQGTIPWKKPWGGQEQAPRSLATRKPYRGVNVFLLHAALHPPRLGPLRPGQTLRRTLG